MIREKKQVAILVSKCSTKVFLMGMDSVEVILSVEDAFGIDIPNEAAANILTLKNLIDYIVEHVSTMAQEKCHTQRIFCKLRRAFRNQIPALEVREIISDVLGIVDFRQSADFVKDLQFD